jgi:fructose-1,6-bisphosphatase/inositol monophosphatase family enzyme
MIDKVQAARVAALLREAVRAEVLPRFRNLAPGAIRAKSGPLDLVTDADEAAERVIREGLSRLFPGCLVVGEEAVAEDPALLGRLAEDGLAFVVDPVDGTANFAAGVPLFGCMAAAMVKGEIVGGWIFEPFGDDCAIALAGQGAWVETPAGDVRALQVRPAQPIGRMVGAISWTYLDEPLRSRVPANMPKLAAAVGYRCSAHEYRLVASGNADALLYNRMMPWDHAPGVIIHREAGGYAARFDGAPYSPRVHSGGLIAAPDEASWAELRAVLLG